MPSSVRRNTLDNDYMTCAWCVCLPCLHDHIYHFEHWSKLELDKCPVLLVLLIYRDDIVHKTPIQAKVALLHNVQTALV